MIKPDADWYKRIWISQIKEMSWTEQTVAQVDFIIDFLGLVGTESVLDLACGFGRHALEFARRGDDITSEYIESRSNLR